MLNKCTPTGKIFSRSMNIWVQLRLCSSINELRKTERSCNFAFWSSAKKLSSFWRCTIKTANSRRTLAALARTASSALLTAYTCQANATKTTPAIRPISAEPARNLRCGCSASVARVSRTLMPYFPSIPCLEFQMSVAMGHPTNESIDFAIRQRPRIGGHKAVGYRGMQKRAHTAVELGLQRLDEIRQARAKSSNAHGSDAFAPGILVVCRNRVDLLEQCLRGNFATVRGKFGAAIAAQHAIAHNRSGQGGAGNARQQRGLFVLEKRNRRERGTQNYAGIQPRALGQRFV